MGLDINESKAIGWLFPFMPERPVIVDVGANKGEWSDIFLQEYKDDCKIYLIEANDTFEGFYMHKYDYNSNVTYRCQAMSDSLKTVKFHYFNNKHSGLSSLHFNSKWAELPNMHERTMQSSTLYLFCRFNNIPKIDFLKIDAEGEDYNVLKGAEQLMEEGRIEFIQIEYSEHWSLINKTISDLISFVGKYDYQVYSFNGNNFELAATDTGYDNLIITKHNIINHSQGWNKVFIENTRGLKIDFAMEIGSCEGLTAQYICEHLLKPEGRLICVDPLEDYYIKPNDMPEMVDQYYRWLRNTKDQSINLYRKKFSEAYDELKDFRFDFCYVDGDHSEEAVYHDAVKSWFLLKKGGYMLFDDYDGYTEGTTKGIDRFLTENKPYYELIVNNYQVMIKKI